MAKFDCTRILLWLLAGSQKLARLAIPAAFLCALVQAQEQPRPIYPEVGRLGHSSYCSPFFGFRLQWPGEFKSDPIYLPVQPHDQHMLLALHLHRLDRTGELFISAFEGNAKAVEPARKAAKEHIQEAHKQGRHATGPGTLRLDDRELLTVHINSDVSGPGSESSFFFFDGGYVLHIAIFSHEPELISAIEKSVAHMDFMEPGGEACRVSVPAAMAKAAPPSSAAAGQLTGPPPERLYYGPALPTELVDATLQQSLGNSVPAGQFAEGLFTDPALGIRVGVPKGWEPLDLGDVNRVTEVMRDPVTDAESWDRRRALFRSCSRALFAAHDPHRELLTGVHPSFVLVAMPLGCIPDLTPPDRLGDVAADYEFASLLLRSTGAMLLERGKIRDADGRIVFNLDGALPYNAPGERLARRLSLRLSATTNGPWLLLVYSVTEAPSDQRELESGIVIGNPSPAE
jgi:hypothetical protein